MVVLATTLHFVHAFYHTVQLLSILTEGNELSH